jgi:tetratricopeptide (TPR) repeat protein
MMPMVACHWFDITDKFQHEETRKLWKVLVKTINCECNLATGPSSLNVNYGHLVHFLSQHLKNEKVEMREDLKCVMLQENLNMSELVRLTLQFGVLRLSEPRVSTVAEITSCLERASSLGNNNIMSMFYCLRAYVRGSCKLSLTELKNDCDLALHFSPNFTIAISNKARALTLEGQCPEAVELYKKCLQLVPNNSLTMAGLADALADMNCVDEALTWYNLAVSSDPDNTTALYNRGILHGERLRSPVRALSDCGLAYRSDGRGADQIARLVNHLRLTSSDPLCAAL